MNNVIISILIFEFLFVVYFLFKIKLLLIKFIKVFTDISINLYEVNKALRTVKNSNISLAFNINKLSDILIKENGEHIINNE